MRAAVSREPNQIAIEELDEPSPRSGEVKIKLEVSLREKTVLPVRALPQIEQEYFKLLPFRPAAIASPPSRLSRSSATRREYAPFHAR